MNTHQILAVHVGNKLDTRTLQTRLGFRITMKEPLVLEYADTKFVVFFRYGVVVFWNFTNGELNEIFAKLSPFITGEFEEKTEEILTVYEDIEGVSGEKIDENGITVTALTPGNVALVSLVLSRSIVLDYFEREVGRVLTEIDAVIHAFARKGRSPLSNRALLQKVGKAMSIEHTAVGQMAMLDKPDLVWEDTELDRFYVLLEKEYELEERYEILNDKLQMLFRSVEFILGYIDGRRGLFLELVIVVLIIIEIGIFFVEHYFL